MTTLLKITVLITIGSVLLSLILIGNIIVEESQYREAQRIANRTREEVDHDERREKLLNRIRGYIIVAVCGGGGILLLYAWINL